MNDEGLCLGEMDLSKPKQESRPEQFRNLKFLNDLAHFIESMRIIWQYKESEHFSTSKRQAALS